MLGFALKRLGLLVLLLLTVSALTFGALNLLGDPLVNILGPKAADIPENAEVIAEAKEQYHLDDALPVRYVRWLGDVIQGDFGRSFANQQEVSTIVREKLPKSLLLMGMAQLLAVAISIPWAVISASRANRPVDRASTVVSFGIISVPNFALGVVLFWLLVVRWGWFPSRFDDTSLWTRLDSLFVPALVLALGLAAVYQRLLRTDLITTLQEDFILMARAKGMSRQRVLWRHALRPSMFSFVTVFGINTGTLIGGSLVIEQIFSIPGAGREIPEAVIRDDYPVVLALVVIIAAGFVIVNFLVDLVYSLLDPRVREHD